MPVSPKLNAEQYAALAENTKGAYRADGSGGYVLDIPVGYYIDDQDPAALLNAKNYVNEENKQLKAKIASIETEKQQALDDAAAAKAKKSGDFDAYKQQTDAQLAKIQQDHLNEIKIRDEALLRNALNSTAMQIASEISGDHAHLMAPVVQQRLSAEMENGIPKISVKDTLGNVSPTSNVETLKKELKSDPRNATIITQSKASGSGAPGSQPSSVITDGKKFSDFSPAALSELRKSGPDGEAAFQKLVAERDSASARLGRMPLGAKPSPVN